MAEWLYKATKRKVSRQATEKLAHDDGFLCRSAFTKKGPRVARTMAVTFGDLIHFYYSDDGEVTTIGSFEIVRRDGHPQGSRFGGLVPKTSLFEVADEDFDAELRSLRGDEGYRPDPVLKRMTGWLIRRREDVRTPAYDATMFPRKTTLVPGR